MGYFSYNNAILINNCEPLQNLKVLLKVTEDLSTVEGAGFTLQLNAYPPPGQTSQGQTLTWLQYVIFVLNDKLYYEIQYWANNSSSWPPGYTPVPGTTPWLPVLPNDYYLTEFGSAPSNQIPRESQMEISLATDSSGNVTSATFSVTDPNANVSSATFKFPEGAFYPISAFEVNLVGPGNGAGCTFTSGLTSSRGIFYYSVSPGTLSVQNGGAGSACGEWAGGTAETSNAIYSDVTPASGSTVIQTLGQPVDCAVNNMMRKETGTDTGTVADGLRHLRDTRLAESSSGLWLTEQLDRHSAELASLLDADPELRSESWALLQKAESTASAGSAFTPDMIDAAENLLNRVSPLVSRTLSPAVTPLRGILESLRGHTLEQGLSATSQTIRPRLISRSSISSPNGVSSRAPLL